MNIIVDGLHGGSQYLDFYKKKSNFSKNIYMFAELVGTLASSYTHDWKDLAI